jgi:hypothetical protein
MDEVEEENFPGFKAFIDITEQEIPRPTKNKSKKRTTTFYSGKKKKHTIKTQTQYMVNNEGLILYTQDSS